jgi:ABC-type transport system involved in multi-copper enzyme maturation permease subunit
MARHLAILAIVLGISPGVLSSMCLGAASPGHDPNPAVSQTLTADSNRPAADNEAMPREQRPNKLLGWWKLDEADGNSVADASGHGRAGMRMGNPQWRPTGGRIGGALEFDGDGDRVEVGDESAFDVTDALTVAAWIKVNKFDKRWQGLVTKGDSAWRLQRTAQEDTLAFHCNGIQSADPDWPMGVVGRKGVNDGQWHHVVAVYDGAAASLYIDGVLDSSSPASGRIATNNFAVVIGGNSERSDREWNGLIDEVCIFGCALKAEEVAALYAGRDPLSIAARIGDRAPGTAAIATTESAPAPEPSKRTGGKWLVLVAVLVASGIIAGARWSGRGRPLRRAAADTARQDLGGSLRHLARGVPGLTWTMARKEFLLNLMTFKFAAATVVCVILTAVFVPMLARDYQERLGTYRDNVTRNEADLRTVKVYQNITPTIFRAPAVLSVFSEGLEKRIADAVTIELDKVPQMQGAASQGNPYQAVFPVFDASLLLKIVLSILALLVAYDAVSGERERGTLKLMLSGTARRHQVLLAKLLAGLLVLVVPVTLTFGIGLVILLSFPLVSLSAADGGRIALMYVASLIFVAALYNVGLLFSCLTKRSPISLVLGLFLWILFAVVVPNGSVYLAAELRPPVPPEKIQAQLASLKQEFQSETEKTRLDGPSNSSQSDARDAFGRGYHRLLNRAFLEYLQEYNRRRYSLAIPYADKFWEVERGHLDSLCAQKSLADGLARLSPICLYGDVMSALAGTDLAAFQRFLEGVRTHRAQLVEYVRLKTDGFSSSSFFTPCTSAEVDEYETLMQQMHQAQSQAEVAALIQAVKPRWEKIFADTPSLDLRDFPAFTMPGALGNVGAAVPGLALLLLVNVLFFALSFVAFLKYDVR